MQKKEFELPEFNKLDVSSSFQVSFVKGSESKAVIEVRDDILDKIQVVIKDQTLYVGLKPGVYNLSSGEQNTATIYCNIPLIGLDASGACNVVFPDSMTCKLKSVDISGASSCTIGVIGTESMDIDVSGASNLHIKSGIINNLSIDCSGASKVNTQNVKTLNAYVDTSGASNSTISANKKAELDASGVSTIVVFGSPKNISSDTSGMSRIKIM